MNMNKHADKIYAFLNSLTTTIDVLVITETWLKPHFCCPRAGLGFEERLGAVLGPICGHHKNTFS